MIRSTFPAAALAVALLVAAFVPQQAAAAGPRAAPEFSLTVQDLRAMTAGLPRTAQDRIVAGQDGFLHLLAQVLDEPPELLVLVDKTHLLPADYVPPDLVKLSGYPLAVSRTDLELRESIMNAVLDMAAAARSAGVTLLFSSSYRSYDYQKSVYDREVKMYGQAAADRESARREPPSTSSGRRSISVRSRIHSRARRQAGGSDLTGGSTASPFRIPRARKG